MKKVYYLLLFLSAVSLSMSVQAQPKKSSWGGHITVRSGGMLTDWALAFINPTRVAPAWLGTVVEHDYRNFPMWAAIYPTSETQRLNNEVGNDEVGTLNPRWWKGFLWPDFDRNYNVAVGYSVDYRWRESPWALSAGLRYEWQGLCVPEGQMQGMHRLQNVVPSIEVIKRAYRDGASGIFNTQAKRHFLEEQDFMDLDQGYDEDNFPLDFNVYLLGNVSYVKNVKYNNPQALAGRLINDGIRLAGGLGLEVRFKEVYYRGEIRYEHDCYNLFNVADVKTRMGRFVGSVSLKF